MAETRLVSLVKYDTPVLVTTKKKKEPGDTVAPTDNIQRTDLSESSVTSAPGLKGPIPPGGPLGTTSNVRPSLPPLKELRNKETEEILKLILPPRQWGENGELWVQSVSTTPATSVEVQQLQEQLDLRLEETMAYENGICPLRRELYTQCFDELIRQVTINCSERGLLLYRVRDQITASLHAYQRLYTSACAYGVRKALMAEEHKVQINSRCENLKEQVKSLESRATELKGEIEQLQSEDQRSQEEARERHSEAKQVNEMRIEMLKKKLDGIIKQATQSKK